MHKAPANAEAFDHLKRWGALETDHHELILCLSSKWNLPVLQGPVKTFCQSLVVVGSPPPAIAVAVPVWAPVLFSRTIPEKE